MARHASKPVKTYTIGYTDMPMFDETAYARQVAAFHKTEHHEIMLDSGAMVGSVPDVLASLDEPFGDSSNVPGRGLAPPLPTQSPVPAREAHRTGPARPAGKSDARPLFVWMP